MDEPELSFSVSEFVEVFNQTLDFAYPSVSIVGELANFRVSKNRWVYFDLKDEGSTVKFFGTVYQLPGPLEDGLMLKVRGQPRLHNLYGFSVNILNIVPSGEGSILKAASLLQAKLAKEGLFDEARKRRLPYPPSRIGLITSKQSAAYADFMKILNARWGGVLVDFIDVQVQGEIAPSQIIAALKHFNEAAQPPDIVVLVRGGGSAEDLAAFNDEALTRAVAASRIVTLVAIGHEIDLSLAEMAADQRASTPSNAAELLVPDKLNAIRQLKSLSDLLNHLITAQAEQAKRELKLYLTSLDKSLSDRLEANKQTLRGQSELLEALSPVNILSRGYAIVRDESNKLLRSSRGLKPGVNVNIQLSKGSLVANVKSVEP